MFRVCWISAFHFLCWETILYSLPSQVSLSTSSQNDTSIQNENFSTTEEVLHSSNKESFTSIFIPTAETISANSSTNTEHMVSKLDIDLINNQSSLIDDALHPYIPFVSPATANSSKGTISSTTTTTTSSSFDNPDSKPNEVFLRKPPMHLMLYPFPENSTTTMTSRTGAISSATDSYADGLKPDKDFQLEHAYHMLKMHYTTDNYTETASSTEAELENSETNFPQQQCEAALPGCHCFDFEVVAGIYCDSIDFFHANRLIDIFEPNETFEVTLNGEGVLRRGTFKGLIVYRVFLQGLMEVEDGVFDGVYRLRRFHVRFSSLKTIPDFRPISQSLRIVHMDNGQLTSVEGPGLTNLPLLTTLSMVNNSIRMVHPLAFQGTENIIIFDLSRNLLSSLPPDTFSPWKKLKKVVLSYNRLLHVDRLFQVANPRFIFLDFNNLTDLDSVLYPDMDQVETLDLSHNPIVEVSNSSFKGRVNATRFIYLDHCRIRSFDVAHYAELTQLTELDLSYNAIEVIEHQTVEFGYNLQLDLTGNRITEFNAELSFNVKRVFLTGNLLTSLGRALRYSQMEDVLLGDNLISSVLASDLIGVFNVRALDLQGNRITEVESVALSTLRRDLGILDLSRNQIKRLGGCVRFLGALVSLNLTANLIENFDEGEFTGLNELTALYLGQNHIATLGLELQQLPQLQHLVVSHNRIRTMHVDHIPKNLEFLYLEENPFKCDCELLAFLMHLNATSIPETDVPLCLQPDFPEATGCPYPCSCACSTSEDHYIEVDCGRRNLSEIPVLFPNTTDETSRFISVTLPRSSIEGPFYLEDEIGALDLSNNRLSVVDEARLPVTLRVLRLDSNFLTIPLVPQSMAQLKSISLGNNPWTCDCDTLLFKKWILSKSDMVVDPNSTMCGPGNLVGRVIWLMMDIDLCPTDVGFYVSLAFAALSFCLLLAGVKIAWTRWSVQVRVWLYSKGVTWAKERDMDGEKHFDAFLSFSHKDSNFVIEQIVNVVEKRAPNVRLCLHYKHFLPGEFITDNILNAVHNSKRTVLILSRNFLESEWCLLEFRAAHVQALRDRVHRVVVIKVGELPDELMDPVLRLYLESTTYLTWGEGNFWDNFLYVLPTSTTCKPSLTLSIMDPLKK
ncbi:hypothetical protein JTE90_028578 [Oedothorax gibbosus]|uniref:TIR domain-containing protein n=1 Tax=Oedothorax gibbosus TaxID=931172 RepID=A0AAV6VXF4_9ARAC|nr:hypothetical protein JTE90_028578 [Oedothorax gibbosus]